MHQGEEKRFLAALVLFMALCLYFFPQHAAAEETGDAANNILRLHVIANSDSEADQEVKLAVRDALLACIEPGESAADAKAFLLGNGARLQQVAEQTLRANGFSYGVQLMLGKYLFPDRTYGTTLYPAGEYEALRVILGRGEGQNWWCVLFPPLCIVTEETEPLPEKGDIEFTSSIASWWRSWRDS